jgi:RHS repeat-associated protein
MQGLNEFIYSPGIDEPICMIDVADSKAVYYYHFNGLGSVVALSDTDGGIVERYSYDVFGEPNRASGISNPYFFTGRRLDTETDNYYYRARYYNPEIGRFLSADPVTMFLQLTLTKKMSTEAILGTDSLNRPVRLFLQDRPIAGLSQFYIGSNDASLNLYTYCYNNPVNWKDPKGESATLIVAAAWIVITTVLTIVALYRIGKEMDKTNKNPPGISCPTEGGDKRGKRLSKASGAIKSGANAAAGSYAP